MSNAGNPTERHPSNRRNPDDRRRSDADRNETAPSPDLTDAQVIALPSAPPPVTTGLFHVAHLLDNQAQELDASCKQLKELMEAFDREIDPDLAIEETFDPEAARRLWRHVPALIELTFGVSHLAFWAHVLRTVLDLERRHGTIR